MTEQEIRDALLDFIKDYCNNDFLVPNPDYDEEDEESEEYIEVIPGGVKIALEKMIEYNKSTAGVTHKTVSRYSVSYAQSYPKSILDLLSPYRKARFY